VLQFDKNIEVLLIAMFSKYTIGYTFGQHQTECFCWTELANRYRPILV